MFYLETLALLAVLGYLFYRWSIAKYDFFEKKNVPHSKPSALLGNVPLGTLTGKESGLRFLINQYKKYENEKLYGIYQFRNPIYIVRDLDLIKKLTIKDFDSFANHKATITADDDNSLAKSLIGLRDRKWKEMRNTLTPTFTGKKIRQMYGLVNEICLEACNHIQNEMENKNKSEMDLEMKNFFNKFANDVVATTAFGLKVNTFADENNEFFTVGKKMTRPGVWLIVKGLLFLVIPKLMKAVGFSLSDDKTVKYFNKLVLDAIHYRKTHQVVRPDMIHLLLEAQKHYQENKPSDGISHMEFNDIDLAAQCLIFFLAGFETVGVCLSFTFYELMQNPDIQEKLYEEVKDCHDSLNGKPLDYESLMKLKYLEMVLSESLRKWPPAPLTERQCSADYKLYDEDGKFLVEFKKDDQIMFPVMGIHYDDKFFPEPEKFIPERFSEENKDRIVPNSYLPFGLGPRNCIGNRFALMETKSIIYHLILNFKVVSCEKTTANLMDAMVGFSAATKELFWMKFLKRE